MKNSKLLEIPKIRKITNKKINANLKTYLNTQLFKIKDKPS